MRFIRYSVLLAVFFTLASISVASSADPHDTAQLVTVRAEIERWLTDNGLSDTLKVEKIRWGARPDDASSQWLKLELRCITNETDPDQENRRIEERFKQFSGTAGLTLAEKLFYKFVHLSGVPRSNAVVHIAVLETNYSIFIDKQHGQLVIQQGVDRNIRQSVALGDFRQPHPTRKSETTLTATANPGDTAKRIQNFLREYFITQNLKSRLPPPQFVLRPLETDYAGLEVQGIKKQVLGQNSYWERLQISIEIKNGAQGRRAVCYLDGQYASGLGTRLPAADAYTDMEPGFRVQLESFTATLLRTLQENLAMER